MSILIIILSTFLLFALGLSWMLSGSLAGKVAGRLFASASIAFFCHAAARLLEQVPSVQPEVAQSVSSEALAIGFFALGLAAAACLVARKNGHA